MQRHSRHRRQFSKTQGKPHFVFYGGLWFCEIGNQAFVNSTIAGAWKFYLSANGEQAK